MNTEKTKNKKTMVDTNGLCELTRGLLEHYQRDFPVSPLPFQTMAEQLNCSEPDVLTKLLELKDSGIVTRIGPVFEHSLAGASLLAAMSVPLQNLDLVAGIISSYPEVNHNYARENNYNLWFVVTAPSKEYLEHVLVDMEQRAGLPILRLPMEKSYHIDLGFHVEQNGKHHDFTRHLEKPVAAKSKDLLNTEEDVEPLDEDQKNRLRLSIQDGLPLTRRPFQRLAQMLNIDDEQRIIACIQSWLSEGLIKRIGLVTNHHRIGFTENAMVVWDISDEIVDSIGEKFKASGLVSLCYRRKRHLPHWPYNFYCMIHSRSRELVAEHVEKLVALADLHAIKKDILFSTRQFKQKGGMYILNENSAEFRSRHSAADNA